MDLSGVPQWQNANPFTSIAFQQPPQVNQQEVIKAHLDKINTCNGSFAEVFHYLYTATPEIAKGYQPVKYINILQGTSKFDAKHEQAFIEKIKQYNELPFSRFLIEYKKDIANCNLLTVSYNLQFRRK